MDTVCFVDGKKLMWDGRAYDSLATATAAQKGYEADGFATHLLHEGDRYFVYSRRVAAPVERKVAVTSVPP